MKKLNMTDVDIEFFKQNIVQIEYELGTNIRYHQSWRVLLSVNGSCCEVFLPVRTIDNKLVEPSVRDIFFSMFVRCFNMAMPESEYRNMVLTSEGNSPENFNNYLANEKQERNNFDILPRLKSGDSYR